MSCVCWMRSMGGMMAEWISEEMKPQCGTVSQVRGRNPQRITVDNPSVFRPGDLIAFPASGHRAYVTEVGKGGELTIDTRYVEHVTYRIVGEREVWNGDDWVIETIAEDLPIPHYLVRNLRVEPGMEAFRIGSAWSSDGPV